MEKFKIYTDGACEPNPGYGGYCAIIFGMGDFTPQIIIGGGVKNTTNNRMEIMGVLSALRFFKEPSDITLFTDSQYVSKSINIWLRNWIRRGEDKKNMDLWKEIYQLTNKHKVIATWIKGHNGNFYNEFADSVSLEAVNKVTKGKRKSFEKIKYMGKNLQKSK